MESHFQEESIVLSEEIYGLNPDLSLDSIIVAAEDKEAIFLDLQEGNSETDILQESLEITLSAHDTSTNKYGYVFFNLVSNFSFCTLL